MGNMFLFSLGAGVLLVTFHFANLLQRKRARSRKMAALGCKEPSKYPHKDPILGLDMFFDSMKAIKHLRFLDNFKRRLDQHGQTFQAISMGRVTVFTNDPKNYQAVHALNFSDYGVQPVRRAPTLPFLGEGVFTMDGPFWEQSRALIRPTFTKSNVANLPAFEVHFQKFLELIPTNGSTVDLKPLLYKLVGGPVSNLIAVDLS